MNTAYYEQEEREISRSEKIQLAKSAFSSGSDRCYRYGSTDRQEENLCLEEGRHHFGILRMVIAGMLFFVLVLSFHLQLSYGEYDKEYVERVLSDDSHWESLVNQVTQVMEQNVQK